MLLNLQISSRVSSVALLAVLLVLSGCPEGDDDVSPSETPDSSTSTPVGEVSPSPEVTLPPTPTFGPQTPTLPPGDDDTVGDDDTTGDDDAGDDDSTGDDDVTDEVITPTPPLLEDADGDGALSDRDCDDADASSYPGADELCDDKDNNCDGTIDDGAGALWYPDADGDGYRDDKNAVQSCDQPEGRLPADTQVDCDDQNAAVHPGALEVCDDPSLPEGIDNNCDGVIDLDAVDQGEWYPDEDSDGYGVSEGSLTSCVGPEGYAALPGDCDDTNPFIRPDAQEPCDDKDNDCDGQVDEEGDTLFYIDADGDGYGAEGDTYLGCSAPQGYVGLSGDCRPDDSASYPGAVETCDGFDNDCDGEVDELAGPTWWADVDGDGAGNPDETTQACEAPAGYVASRGDPDCDDGDPLTYPGADEICDGVDNDCDADLTGEDGEPLGGVDEGVIPTWYRDVDGDTWGDDLVTREQCEAPYGYVDRGGDCNDRAANTYPGAEEICDGRDNDCDDGEPEGGVDEGVKSEWYIDRDGDGVGAGQPVMACSAPTGAYVSSSGDCNDLDASSYPGALEVCDGKDNDCNGTVDDIRTDDPPEGTAVWYLDADGDGYGQAASSTLACAEPSGYSADFGDCDDTNEAVNPGALEVCNNPGGEGGQGEGIDDNCDGIVDVDAVDRPIWYVDADQDGYGDDGTEVVQCAAPTDTAVHVGGDCDDTRSSIYPGAPETCNGLDDDCDQKVDGADPDLSGAPTWYIDYDQDGYGVTTYTREGCTQPAGFVDNAEDCNDANQQINPGAEEICDRIDHNCDGLYGTTNCTNCAAILSIDPDSQDGFYAIDPDGDGPEEAFDVYCDMSTQGGGWTLFWWYEADTGMSGVSDVLAMDLWDCDPVLDGACYARIPVTNPRELLVVNNFGNWAAWRFDSANNTSLKVFQAFTQRTRTSRGSACGSNWNAVAQSGTMTDTPYHCDENNNDGSGCKCFWYDSQGGVYSFYLDDDTGWAETAFAAGKDYDQNYLGVDSLETTYRYNSTSYSLWLYWR